MRKAGTSSRTRAVAGANINLAWPTAVRIRDRPFANPYKSTAKLTPQFPRTQHDRSSFTMAQALGFFGSVLTVVGFAQSNIPAQTPQGATVQIKAGYAPIGNDVNDLVCGLWFY